MSDKKTTVNSVVKLDLEQKDQNVIERAINRAMSRIGLGPKASTEAKDFKKKFDEGLLTLKKHGKDKKRSLSDRDVRSAIQAALEVKDNPFAFVVAVFADSFIFEDFMEGGMFEQSFSIEEDGTVILGEELVKVRPETDFIPVKTNEVTGMSKEEVVKGLITDEANKVTEDDQKWLMTLEDGQLEKLAPEEVKEPTKEEVIEKVVASSDDENKEEEKEEEKDPTAEEYIADAPEEIREILNEGLSLQRATRSDLIKHLTEHKDNKFGEDELKAMSTKYLHNLVSLAHVNADYSARGGPRTLEVVSNQAPPAPKIFENKQAS